MSRPSVNAAPLLSGSVDGGTLKITPIVVSGTLPMRDASSSQVPISAAGTASPS